MPPFESIAVVGAGAVGSFCGALLAQAGLRVTLIGRPAHVQAIARDGLQLEMGGRVQAIDVAATTALAAAGDADLILFCVKSTDTETTARALAPLLRADAIVLSLQNGVENAALIAQHVRRPVVPAVVYVAVSVPAPGRVRHAGRGELRIGPPVNADAAGGRAAEEEIAARLDAIVALFARTGIEMAISSDVAGELWSKLLLNCAYNAISALAQAPYARIAALPEVVAVQQAVVHEVVAVAAADGVPLSLEAGLQATARLAATMPAQTSSTAQDLARRRPSEIDHLNGYVVRRGRALGVPTPANETLYALVRLVESGFGSDG
jgi:2-dehydropantoate 2-reductase